MKNINKIAVCVNVGSYFLKEGIIISEDRFTTIKFGINDIQTWGPHMFVLKDDLVDYLDGLKIGDVKYFMSFDEIFEITIMHLIKHNPERFSEQSPNPLQDVSHFIGKCSPQYFNGDYISDAKITDLFDTKKQALKLLNILRIKRCKEEIARLQKQLKKLEEDKSKLND